jgi:hypothetical protein
MSAFDHYLPEAAIAAVQEIATLSLRERLLRETFVLHYDEDEDALESKFAILMAALDAYEEAD